MIARIPDSLARTAIFNNVSRFRDTQHYIQQQMPPSQSERRQFALTDFKSLKTDPKNKAILTQGKLFVKNKLHTQYSRPLLPDQRPTDVPPTPITESKERKDSGSVFKGYCAKVTDVQDVAQTKSYLVSNKPEVTKASHVIYAYRLETSRGKVSENFDSDRYWATGHELIKMTRENNMVNTVCIATRMCNSGFLHIGKKRFSHINDLCLQAYNSLQNM